MKRETIIKGTYVLGDCLAVFLATVFAFWIRFYSGWFSIEKGIPELNQYFLLTLFTLPVMVTLFVSWGLYKKEKIYEENYKVWKAFLSIYVLFFAFTFAYREISYSRTFMGISFIISCLTVMGIRSLFRQIKQHLFQEGYLLTKTLIITSKERKAILESQITQENGYVVVKWVTKKELEHVSQRELKDIEEIIIDVGIKENIEIIEVINSIGRDKRYTFIPSTTDILTKKTLQSTIGNIQVLRVRESPLEGWGRYVKEITDMCGALCLIFILSPLFLLIVLLIKLDSKGPIFYKQERTSYNNKSFSLYKFRSMIQDAEKRTGPKWADNNDPRITRMGNFLRKTNLDELPQLWNVLKGEMSLVGPRPERPHFIEQFKRNIPHYLERCAVKGGMTGWAQVNGLYGNTSLEERIKHDVYYIENWSFILDLKIIIKTIKLIFFRKNS